MNEYFRRLWWALGIRGLLLLAFGIIAVSSPVIPFATLVSYLGFILLGTGGLTLIITLVFRKNMQTWLAQTGISLLDIVLGVCIVMNISQAAGYFIILLGIWATLMGISMLFLFFKVKGLLRVILLINTLISIAFALVFFLKPFGESSLNFMVGLYTILLSVFLVYLSFRMRVTTLFLHETAEPGNTLSSNLPEEK